MNRVFAEEYHRNEDGWILFPGDAYYRKELFSFWDRLGLKLSDHPAKANMFLVQSCVEYVSEPEETIMDIMAGTGTILVAALIGRRVVCIEIEDYYCNLIEEGAKDIDTIAPGAAEMVTLVPADCTRVLPIAVDHIIFSPPYAQIFKKTSLTSGLDKDKFTQGTLQYANHPNNISNLNEFLYHQKMELIYKKALESLRPGGTLTILIKDHMIRGNRMYLGERAKRDCLRLDYELDSHHKWLPHGSVYSGIRQGRGEEVVDDEDIIILRRPK